MTFILSLLAILNEMSPYILLGFFFAGLLEAFVKPAMMSRHLAGGGMKPVVKAALLGVPLPLCSCGVLPTAVSLRRAGASKGATTSFLIATPQTGVDSIAATYSLLGPAMAVARPVAALLCAIVGGSVVSRVDSENPAEADADAHCDCNSPSADDRPRGFPAKLRRALRYGFVDMIQHVGKWLVIGLVVAALITVLVPDDLLVGLSRYPLAAMLVMVAIAVPMYICATGSIPIALSLMLKGLSPGVAFVMLMAGPAANFASVMVLRRSMGTRATAVYIASVVVTAILFGLIIDCLLPASWFAPATLCTATHAGCAHGAAASFGIFDSICSAVLVALLCYAFIATKLKSKPIPTSSEMEKRTYKVKGMMCPHCSATVERGLKALEGADQVAVDLSRGEVTVAGPVSPTQVLSTIHSLGYEATLPE